MSRLDDAIAEGKLDERVLSPTSRESGNKDSILEKAAEYLFDIFDANCMEEHHIINSFDERAIKSFPVEEVSEEVSEEITFEQERLHNEFLGIFEDLLGRFLRTEGITSVQFFELVKSNFHGGRRMCQAIEVVDVIFCYTEISQWHTMMRENALQRKRWDAHRKTALQEAAELCIQGQNVHGQPKKNRETHRLDTYEKNL